MSVSSFVLILWVHVFLVQNVETSDVRNLKLLLSRNRRDNPSAGNSTMTLDEQVADIDARVKDLLAKKEALVNTTTEASSSNDVTTTEGPVPAANSEDPKDGWLKTELENILDSTHKIDDKLEKLLKYLRPDTPPPATAKVEPSGMPSPDQGENETTLSSQTTPRSEAAPSDATAPGETVANGTPKDETVTGETVVHETSKDETVTSKPGANGTSKKGPAKDETDDEKKDVAPTPSKSIETLMYIIVVLVVIIVAYCIYVNKAKIKACYTGGEKKGEDKPGTKSRSEIKYEKLKKDDDDLTLFEKKALKSNYIY